MYASHKICHELVCVYDQFAPMPGSEFKGYKLVQKTNLNYYSIVTGLFRYKSKNVSQNSYHELHRKSDSRFTEKLVDRVAIFKNEEEAYKTLIGYHEIDRHNYELAMLEITISGSLEQAVCSNREYKGAEVVIGDTIEKVKEIKLYNEHDRTWKG
jgi:hypothetical protein